MNRQSLRRLLGEAVAAAGAAIWRIERIGSSNLGRRD
jgi:hypothetical protein